MKHTRPTITRILDRIAELEKAREYYAEGIRNAKTEFDAASMSNLFSQTHAAINELKALVGE